MVAMRRGRRGGGSWWGVRNGSATARTLWWSSLVVMHRQVVVVGWSRAASRAIWRARAAGVAPKRSGTGGSSASPSQVDRVMVNDTARPAAGAGPAKLERSGWQQRGHEDVPLWKAAGTSGAAAGSA